MNEVVHGDGFYISYNPFTGGSILGSFFDSDDGQAETALCITNGASIRFLILNGDFRSEYRERIESLDDCIAFFESQKDEHGSSWSEE